MESKPVLFKFQCISNVQPITNSFKSITLYYHFCGMAAKQTIDLVNSLLTTISQEWCVLSHLNKSSDYQIQKNLSEIKQLAQTMLSFNSKFHNILVSYFLNTSDNDISKMIAIFLYLDMFDIFDIETLIVDPFCKPTTDNAESKLIKNFCSANDVTINEQDEQLISHYVSVIQKLIDRIISFKNDTDLIFVQHFTNVTSWFMQLVEDYKLTEDSGQLKIKQLARFVFSRPNKPYYELLGCSSLQKTRHSYKIVAGKLLHFVKEINEYLPINIVLEETEC